MKLTMGSEMGAGDSGRPEIHYAFFKECHLKHKCIHIKK